MLYMFGVLIGASLLGHISDKRTNLDDGKVPKRDIYFFFTAILLVCFLGLRTAMNDTYSYMRSFKELEPFKDIKWVIGSNPMFAVYESIIKKFISPSANVFIFLSSAFVVGTYVWLLKKHSANFGYSIFLFISIGTYGFIGGAMKQTIATALALIAVDRYIQKKRLLLPIILLVVAVLVHPYVVIYAAVPFLMDGVWNKKSILILLGTFAISAGFSLFIEKFIEVTDAIGESYDISTINDGVGINFFRVVVYAVIPILSFVYREKIRESDDKFLFLAVNLSMLSCCFCAISLNGAAYALGRMIRYMDSFQCLVLPYIVKKCIKDKQTQSLIFVGSVVCFVIYFYYSYKKYLIWGFASDWYERISIFELIKGWRG